MPAASVRRSAQTIERQMRLIAEGTAFTYNVKAEVVLYARVRAPDERPGADGGGAGRSPRSLRRRKCRHCGQSHDGFGGLRANFSRMCRVASCSLATARIRRPSTTLPTTSTMPVSLLGQTSTQGLFAGGFRRVDGPRCVNPFH